MTATDSSVAHSYDALVVGGGPGGSTVATLLAQYGLRVAIFEQASFPRFHIGESLLPANVPIFERLGCHDALRHAGFLVKPGASFYDEYEGRGLNTFAFEPYAFQPAFAYNVVRASFDDILLHNAASAGCEVYRQHTVRHPCIEPDKVMVQVSTPQGTQQTVQARVLVDASGRSALLGGTLGQREPLPDLGKVALFGHFQGARRDPAIPDGNIRIHLVRDGWIWWIPFANGTDSVGCVLHAKVVKERGGSVEALFDEVLTTSPRLTQGLGQARRITPVHTAANFSYRIVPMVGDRYLAVGDATGFVDPIFSAGVFIAMHSAELAAEAIIRAFRRQDFSARAFRPYAARLHRGIAPFLAMIQHFYEPAFLDVFFSPNPPKHLYHAVLWVLSGASFDHQPWWLRSRLGLFFTAVRLRQAVRWATGLPVESRWYW
jgi:flavin-dependent dehydrogenase